MKQFASEFLLHRRALMAFIGGLVRDSHAAEDICQEVWLRLAAAVEQGAAIENQARWCRGVAKNLILHHWRERRDGKVVVDSELLDKVELAFTENEEETGRWSDRAAALRECLNALPPRSGQMVRMRYDSGYSVAAMATILSQSVDSVMKALSRIRKALGVCVDKRLKTGRGA